MPPSPPAYGHPRWRIAIDTGGTFTDCLAIDPAGRRHRAKVLSSGALRAEVLETDGRRVRLLAPWGAAPRFALGARARAAGSEASIGAVEPGAWIVLESGLAALRAGDPLEITTGEEAPILAARVVTDTPAGEALPPMELRLATTRGTNALLERAGAPTAFFVTRGFGDLLVIGDQTRPDIFSLDARRPAPLHDRVVEVRERLDARGRVLEPLDADALRRDAEAVLDTGVRVAAVSLMHAWLEPSHERAARELLLACGFEHVSMSSDLGASIGLLARAETTLVNAYLTPVIDRYLDRVQRPLCWGSSLLVMSSAGGLLDRPTFRPKDSLLSGPAGGVIGAAEAGRRLGHDRVVTFDMGGTSTDCARCDGVPERVYQTRVGDARILAPSVAVETVAAGGGSVCSVETGELRVGPRSAGADPGPACYGRGGPLTLTDCNLLLGRLDPSRFAVPLQRGAAEAAAAAALDAANRTLKSPLSLEQLLAGFIDVADQRMSEAVRRITIRRGHDPAEHALVAFGGAGPQHACAIAAALDMTAVIVPPDAGLLSARGLEVAALERVAQRQVLRPLDEAGADLPRLLDDLASEAADGLGEGSAPAQMRPTAELRFLDQGDIVELDASEPETLQSRFLERYRALFGHVPAGRLELVAARVTATRPAGSTPPTEPAQRGAGNPPPRTSRVYTSSRRWCEAPVLERGALGRGLIVHGPALITEAHSTTFVDEGWRVCARDALVLERCETPPAARPARDESVEVQLAAGKLGAIALEMGERLRRTALSTNVKERHDFSCAILDDEGRLVVNAPHVPVHLGSMGVCTRAVRHALGPALGGTVVTNHPAFGGSHLPDVTVVHPVIDGGRLLGYTACRAHHAEIGGIAPGSMAPHAVRLSDEGVVIPPTVLGDERGIDWDAARALFTAGPVPSRDPDTNVRDLAAAIHAAWAGADALRALARTIGAERFGSLGRVIRERAAGRVREALRRRGNGEYAHTESLDDGTPIRVAIRLRDGAALIDFAGSGPVHPRCLNATPAIVTSAVIYVLRALIDEPLPLNEGLLDPVELRIPPGLLSPEFPPEPSRCPAVAGGNVELSQVLVEAMLTALGVCAQGQGTMNNVVFGAADFGFYETLGGGAGALPSLPGAHAVHSHMTNTALTDAELLEHRFPVRLERCAVRRGSGGRGVHSGGDGIERSYRFLREVDVSVLAERRTRPPQGLAGGAPGLAGAQSLLPAGGAAHEGFQKGRAPAGAMLRILTPGGGGYGSRESGESKSGNGRNLRS